ncbi:type V toxin-antitoxin system endoribonuclease antitoxin GhoS [Trabulsiella odontotermitis]|uniref:Uncharacterized protein n=1 Tax=Trabulsiella odontotermitis TaxID=379893 RepID=A0A0L0GIJ3_9ENTR|nr:type V toxin-antitoxin system endoribonuclease antitoxin GhoS [Trabulsiella odontotermitis]KNC88802.1 hypothetical protein GM30_10655 [Trabulsiella odontotermitis]KNC94517.1 hypothetical protein GM31_14020 [Trabulsiella odontotermitis]
MSGEITRYVVTFRFKEDALTQINELNNHLSRGGFLLTLADDDGKVHDLGTNTFGLISPLSEEEVRELAAGLAEAALNVKPDIEITTFETWQAGTKQ